MDSQIKFDIELNTKELETTTFPQEFNIEIHSLLGDSNPGRTGSFIPFVYSQYLTFETEEKIETDTETNTDTESQTDTNTNTESQTDTSTNTDTQSETDTSTNTDTQSETDTSTNTDTQSQTDTSTDTATESQTDTSTNTNTETQTGTSTDTNTDVSQTTFSISYELNGGVQPETPNPETYGVASEAITLNPPTKNGHTFTGWTGDNGNEPQTIVVIAQGSTGDKHYTANWNPINYTISYELNGGEAINPTIYTITSSNITLNPPTKNGYTFTGWTGDNGNTPQTSVIIEQGSIGNKNYIANWSIITYSINYALNGGTATNPTTYNVTTDNIAINPPVRDGHTFSGWTGTDLNAPTIELVVPKGSIGDRTYTANWDLVDYTISYELDGGTVATPNPTVYNQSYNDITLGNPTKTGYTFLGWSGTGLNGNNNTSVIIPLGSTGDRSYTANWQLDSYTISYNLNGGTPTGSNPTSYDVNSANITLSNPEKIGCVFVGWSGTDLIGIENTTVTIAHGSTGNKSYIANWASGKYTLTVNKGEGISTVTGAGSYEYNDNVTVSCTVANGYEFDSWTGDRNTANFTMPPNDVTMQANARAINYNIEYDYNGGAGSNPVTYNVSTPNLTLTTPSYDGYSFDGWTGSNGNVAQKNVTITQGSTGDKSYKANWTHVKYTIAYKWWFSK